MHKSKLRFRQVHLDFHTSEQIEACHTHDIRVQWDHFSANQHPEWLVVDEKGCPQRTTHPGSLGAAPAALHP
ncbi:MAG: hypothetical protein MUO62_05270 [Anaerolineales bacterium]|nr:hypothetical protein [Anaerolineales bacterium]